MKREHSQRMSEQSDVGAVNAVVSASELVEAVGSAEACNEADRGADCEDGSVYGSSRLNHCHLAVFALGFDTLVHCLSVYCAP